MTFDWVVFLFGPLAFFDRCLIALACFTVGLEFFLLHFLQNVRHEELKTILIIAGVYRFGLAYVPDALYHLESHFALPSNLPRIFCVCLGMVITASPFYLSRVVSHEDIQLFVDYANAQLPPSLQRTRQPAAQNPKPAATAAPRPVASEPPATETAPPTSH